MREGAFSGVAGEWLVLSLRWETQALKSRISKRVHQMVADGWLEEIEEIVGRGYGDQVRAFTAIGYQFMLQVLEGTKTLDEAIDLTVRQTQKYAKRQMTWFRREHDVQWLDCPIDEQAPLEIVGNFLGDYA